MTAVHLRAVAAPAAMVLAVMLLAAGCVRRHGGAPAPATTTSASTAVLALAACPTGPGGGGAAQLPPISLACFAGRGRVHLPDLAGQPTVINLWASWCLPCRRETPRLQQAHHDHPAIRFLGVDSSDEHASARDFLATFAVTYPQLEDHTAVLLHRLGMPGLPATIVIDTTGRIVYRHAGELLPDQLTQALATAT